MTKASTGLAGERDSIAVPFPRPHPGYDETQSTASVPIVDCLNGGVHPIALCLKCAVAEYAYPPASGQA